MALSVLPVLLLAASVTSTRAGPISDMCAGNSSLDNAVIRITANETLQLNDNCRVSSAVNLTLQASPGVTVKCPGVAFVFTNVSSLTIRGLRFVGCGGTLKQQDVAQFKSPNSFFDFKAGYSAVILCLSCSNLTLDNVWFYDNIGYALAALNLFGISLLSGLKVDGTGDHRQNCASADTMYACTRGILILFTDSDQGQNQNNNVSIVASSFDSNQVELASTPNCLQVTYNEYNEGSMNNIIPKVGALTVAYSQSNYTANVGVFSSNFTNNTGPCFGAVFILHYVLSPANATQLFHNCTFMSNRLSAMSSRNSWNHFGKDITIYAGYKAQTLSNVSCLSIVDSHFWSNEEAKTARSNFWDDTESKNTSVFLAHLYSSRGQFCVYGCIALPPSLSSLLYHCISLFNRSVHEGWLNSNGP